MKRPVSDITPASNKKPNAGKQHVTSENVLMYRTFYDKETGTWDLSEFTLTKPFEGKKNSVSWELSFGDRSLPILSPWCRSSFAPSLIVKKDDEEGAAANNQNNTVTKHEGPPPALGDPKWLTLELGYSMDIESSDKDKSFNDKEKEFIDEYFEFLKALKERIVEIVVSDPKTYLRTSLFEKFLKNADQGAPMIEKKKMKKDKEIIEKVPKYTSETFNVKDLTEDELKSFTDYVRRVVKDPYKLPSDKAEKEYDAVKTQKFKVNHVKKDTGRLGRGAILCDFWDYSKQPPEKMDWTGCGRGKYKSKYTYKVWNAAGGISLSAIASSVSHKNEGEVASRGPPKEEDPDQVAASELNNSNFSVAELDKFLLENQAFIENGFTATDLTAYLGGDELRAANLIAECNRSNALMSDGQAYFRKS